jgi:hypothetical protein
MLRTVRVEHEGAIHPNSGNGRSQQYQPCGGSVPVRERKAGGRADQETARMHGLTPRVFWPSGSPTFNPPMPPLAAASRSFPYENC